MGDRFSNSAKAVYVCLDEIEGVRPRTEFAIGKPDHIEEAGREYKHAASPFVVLYFRDNANNNHGIARIVIPEDHKDVSTDLLHYINRVKTELVEYMKQQNPGCKIRGVVGVEGTNDDIIKNMFKRYVRLEEIVEYVI